MPDSDHIVNTGVVDCPVCRAPAGQPCRSAIGPGRRGPHQQRVDLAVAYHARDPESEQTVLIDLIDTDLNPPSDDLILRALRSRAGAYGLTVRIAPADHAPPRAVYPLRLELVDARDGRRVIAGYTATAPGGSAGTGLRTLLAVLP